MLATCHDGSATHGRVAFLYAEILNVMFYCQKKYKSHIYPIRRFQLLTLARVATLENVLVGFPLSIALDTLELSSNIIKTGKETQNYGDKSANVIGMRGFCDIRGWPPRLPSNKRRYTNQQVIDRAFKDIFGSQGRILSSFIEDAQYLYSFYSKTLEASVMTVQSTARIDIAVLKSLASIIDYDGKIVIYESAYLPKNKRLDPLAGGIEITFLGTEGEGGQVLIARRYYLNLLVELAALKLEVLREVDI